jgi:hypothetical protein
VPGWWLRVVEISIPHRFENISRKHTFRYLRQIPYSGGAITRVSCSKAYKGAPASDTGTDVTWVDFAGGRSQIVTNGDDPVGPCS